MPTKEQVLKRVAEIEGLQAVNDRLWRRQNEDGTADWIIWNPLDNPSDWAVLIEKYVQTIEKHPDSPNIKEHWRGKYTVLTLDDAGVATHESLPWAICLAIIESKGGMGDE